MLPLSGFRVLELEGIGPGPLACCMLADWGADVVTVCRAAKGKVQAHGDATGRGKRSIAVDLKSAAGLGALKTMVSRADVFVEPFRPGVAEKLGLGPEELLAANPALIYGRMTGYGQGGVPEWEQMAGHDNNYLALAGTLSLFTGETERGWPVPPINFAGDYAGGATMLAFGVLLALLERSKSGKGQVVDAAMTDGSAYISLPLFKMLSMGHPHVATHPNGHPLAGFPDPARSSMNQAQPWGRLYECADGKLVSVQSMEPQFYAALLKGLGINKKDLPPRGDESAWPAMKARFATVFATKTRDEWEKVFTGTDACVAPVLSTVEAATHPHNVARGTFAPTPGKAGTFEPAPAPKLSRTPGHVPRPTPTPGADTRRVLGEYGFSVEQVAEFLKDGSVAEYMAKL